MRGETCLKNERWKEQTQQNVREKRRARRPASSCGKRCTMFGRENTARDRRSRPSRSVGGRTQGVTHERAKRSRCRSKKGGTNARSAKLSISSGGRARRADVSGSRSPRSPISEIGQSIPSILPDCGKLTRG